MTEPRPIDPITKYERNFYATYRESLVLFVIAMFVALLFYDPILVSVDDNHTNAIDIFGNIFIDTSVEHYRLSERLNATKSLIDSGKQFYIKSDYVDLTGIDMIKKFAYELISPVAACIIGVWLTISLIVVALTRKTYKGKHE